MVNKMKRKINKKQLKSICQDALENNADLNIESAMYTDVELKIYKRGE